MKLAVSIRVSNLEDTEDAIWINIGERESHLPLGTVSASMLMQIQRIKAAE